MLTIVHSTLRSLRLTRRFGTVLGPWSVRLNKSILFIHCRTVALSTVHASEVDAIMNESLSTASTSGNMRACRAAGVHKEQPPRQALDNVPFGSAQHRFFDGKRKGEKKLSIHRSHFVSLGSAPYSKPRCRCRPTAELLLRSDSTASH